MTQVFICHAREDHSAALPIIEAIGQAGLTVSLSDAVSPGEAVLQEVRHALDTAQCVVILWSKAASQSRFLHQAIHAWSSDRPVLAALDGTPLPLGLRDLSPISIRGESGSGAKQLIERAQAIIQQGGIARPPNSNDASPAPPPARPERRRRFAAIIAASLIVGFAVLTGLVLVRSWLAQQRDVEAAAAPMLNSPIPAPTVPALPIPRDPLLPLIVMVLVFGASIGTAAGWVWIVRSRRRSQHAPSEEHSRQTLVGSTGDPQVFVSYSRNDGPTVWQLVQQIEQLGYAVWIESSIDRFPALRGRRSYTPSLCRD